LNRNIRNILALLGFWGIFSLAIAISNLNKIEVGVQYFYFAVLTAAAFVTALLATGLYAFEGLLNFITRFRRHKLWHKRHPEF